MQGVIVENISNIYNVELNGKIYETTARGKFKNNEISPVVGDIVEIEIIDEQNKKAVITKIKDRNVFVKRPKLSNVTQIILVVSINNPKPDLLLLDKQLAFAEFLGINAIIVLNKIDLDKQNTYKEIKNIYEKIGYSVIETNAKDKKGIDELNKKLLNNISAFSGNSGVGKSTLINDIFDLDITKEGEISKKSKRGKNTTTSVKLYKINQNSYIADTPGFSTFDISEIESKKLVEYFREFKDNIYNCEFVSCTHIKEDNCGIKKAIQDGKINNSRYERFCKIYEELKQKEAYKKW